MEHKQPEMLHDDKQNRNRRRLLLLLGLLLFLVAVSSCMVGYVLGQRTRPNDGRMIDTIILSPVDSSKTVPLSLSGIVRYTDGTPCAGKKIELRSEPRVTLSDEKGRFFFHDIGHGHHRIRVFDESGEELAVLELTVSENQSGAELSLLPGGGYRLSVPVDVLLAEIALELDSGTGELSIGDGGLCIVQTDGRVTTQSGNADAAGARFVLTPQSNAILPDGTVNMPGNGVLLNDGTYIAPDKTVTYPAGTAALPRGVEITEDAKVILSDGTVISLTEPEATLPDGTIIRDSTIILPDGTIIDNDKKTITSPDGTEVALDKPGTLPDGTVVGEDGTVTTPGGVQITPPDGGGYIVGNDDSRPIGTGEDGGRVVIRENASGVIWTQQTKIDLFKDAQTLCPGTSGSYQFSIRNTQSFDVGFTMEISEVEHEAGAIPFEYRLKSGEKYAAGSENGWMTAEQLKDVAVSLASGGNTVYTLEWRWPFDSGNDERDTRLGSHDNTVHTIVIIITAEQSL